MYPQNSQQIIKRAEELIQKLKTAIGAIITCPIEQQSKETMLYAFDRAYNNLSTEMGVLELWQVCILMKNGANCSRTRITYTGNGT